MASYPGSIVSLTNPQGTNLLTSPDHGALHTSENNEIVALESLLGTTAAANGLFNSYTSGQIPLPIQSGTIGTIVSKGTINTSVFGTNQYTGGTLGTANLIGGTLAGQIQNNGTIANGVYGTALHKGGTISGAVIDSTNILTTGNSVFSQTNIASGGTFNGGTINVCAGTITLVNPSQVIIVGNMDAFNTGSAGGYKCFLYQGTTQLTTGPFGKTSAANARDAVSSSYAGSFSAGTLTFYLAAQNTSDATAFNAGNVNLSILAIPG